MPCNSIWSFKFRCAWRRWSMNDTDELWMDHGNWRAHYHSGAAAICCVDFRMDFNEIIWCNRIFFDDDATPCNLQRLKLQYQHAHTLFSSSNNNDNVTLFTYLCIIAIFSKWNYIKSDYRCYINFWWKHSTEANVRWYQRRKNKMKWNEWEKKKQQQQSGMEGARTPVNRVKWIDMGEIYSLSFSGCAAINNQTTPRRAAHPW